MNSQSHVEPAAVASDTGALAKNVAGAVSGSHSKLERLGEAAAAAKLGFRVLPAAWKLAKRRPVQASLAVVALAAAAYLIVPLVRSRQRNRRWGP